MKTNCEVDNELMFRYFENVLGTDPPDLCDEVLNLLNNVSVDDINIDILDCEIKEDEIIKAILKLKSGKKRGKR